MSDNTKIEWADATLNPAYGCSKVSPACANCYALRDARRFMHNPSAAHLFAGLVENGEWSGKVNLFPKRMEQALRWRQPRRIFVGSMTDLFHPDVPFEFLDRVFAVMAAAKQHTFMLLTKRPERMREYICGRQQDEADESFGGGNHGYLWGAKDGFGAPAYVPWPLPNVWLGVTAEKQEQADARIPILLDTPAAKRFVSVEPMLGPVSLGAIKYPEAYDAEVGLLDALRGLTCDDSPTHPALDWVICGGESGPGARPMHQDWVRSLRDQCAEAQVPFMFKQWGEWKPLRAGDGEWPVDSGSLIRLNVDGTKSESGWPMQRVGKKFAGRMLDGVEHDGIPEAACPA